MVESSFRCQSTKARKQFHIPTKGGDKDDPGAGVGMLRVPVIFPGASVGIWFGAFVGAGHWGTKQHGSFGSDTIVHSVDLTGNVGHLKLNTRR